MVSFDPHGLVCLAGIFLSEMCLTLLPAVCLKLDVWF